MTAHLPPERSLDQEIADTEQRIADRRAQLRATLKQEKERMRASIAKPQMLLAVLALGFAAARLARIGARDSEAIPRKSSRARRLLRIVLSGVLTRLLPMFLGPLQGLATHWLGRRFG